MLAYERARATSMRGVVMLEVLITLLILLLGLLGVVGLMVRANTSQMESYQRVQALILLEDMRNRIESNRAVATCYASGPTGTQFGTGYAGTPSCTAGSAAQNQQAIDDMSAWNDLLLGSAESKGGAKLGAMLGARGCISEIDAANRIYMVTVAWQGLEPTVAPAVTCGQGQYGSDALRRALTVTVRIGTLS
jgi:type IV pilus assembly protein PilV